MKERARVPVFEIMTTSPVTVSPGERVDRVAALMRAKDIGSVIAVEDGQPVGIVTERDLVTKVTAENRVPSSILVKDVMSAPVVSVTPDTEVIEAAKHMSERGFRRLAVVKDGQLMGIITENDILRVWPNLIEITREQARAGLLDGDLRLEGHCESCGLQSTDLALDEGLWKCPDCRGR